VVLQMRHYRIFYVEDQEDMPVRSDLCIMAKNRVKALIVAAMKLGGDFRVLRVRVETEPSNVINLAMVVLFTLILSSSVQAQPYTVLLNPWYGAPGESQFIVEDNGTLTTPVNRKPHKPKQVSNPGGGYVYQEVYQSENYHAEHSMWNPLLLRKQIDNIDQRLLTATGIERERYLVHRAERSAILSTVEGEIARSPQLSR
jgi:hypothetical protein